MSDVKDDAIILSSETESEHGIDVTTTRGYQAPLDGTFDEFEAADQALAVEIATVLKSKYWGYEWKIVTEIRDGYVAFQLSELMGPTLHGFIRIHDYNRLSKKVILDVAGDILERVGLPRDRVDLDAYRAAKLRLHTFEFHDIGRKSA